jgi:hypothetical protein
MTRERYTSRSIDNKPVQACICAEVQVLISVSVVLDAAADMLILIIIIENYQVSRLDSKNFKHHASLLDRLSLKTCGKRNHPGWKFWPEPHNMHVTDPSPGTDRGLSEDPIYRVVSSSGYRNGSYPDMSS